MQFIGQERLLKSLSDYTIDTLPHTMLFIGEQGCGKHTIVNMLAEKLKLSIIEIDKDTTEEELIDYQQKPVKTIYVIDFTKLSLKQQNQYLKFIEEPSKYSYMILIAESETSLLATVLNRCKVFKFSAYSKEELQKINSSVTDDLIFEICNTPGQIKSVDSAAIVKLNTLCMALIDHIKEADFASTLSIYSMINYRDEYDKYDFYAFFKMMRYCAAIRYKEDKILFEYYNIINKYCSQLVGRAVNKEQYMLSFLTDFWKETHTNDK